MIVRLPRDLRVSEESVCVPEKDPELVLKPVEDGVFLYSVAGKLVGQSLFDQIGATVSVGDAKSYRIDKDEGGKIRFAPFVEDEKSFRYETYGNVGVNNYSLYEYRPGSVLPVLAARVTPEPLDHDYYYADLSESANVFRTLLFVATVSHLSL